MNSLQKAIIYLKMSAKAIIRYPSLNTFKGTIRHFPEWWQHLEKGKSSVRDSKPWLAFEAIAFIKKIVQPNMVVFEYGSGGSTLFWSQNVAKVISIEHERSWYEKMVDEFAKRRVQNVEYILAEAQNDTEYSIKSHKNPKHYISADPQFAGQSFESYVKQIDRFPDQSLDIIIVDGRARPSCILHSINKLKVNGYLVVDNSERKYYLASFLFNTPQWKMWKFHGPVPYNYHFSDTTVFQKLSN